MTSIFDKQTIGDLILAYRKKNHLRREIMADRLGVATGTIQRWESGSQVPSLRSMVLLSEEMGMSLREIFKIVRG